MSLKQTPMSGLEDVVSERINHSYLIPRKSYEPSNGDQQVPLTLTPEVTRFAHEFLKNHDIDPTQADEITGWEMFWAREMAAAMVAIPTRGGAYQMFLPGRFLHYDLLAHNISSLFNGGENSIEGKTVAEIGSGSGLGLMKLAQRGASVAGLDYSLMAIDFARYLADHYQVKDRVKMVRGDYWDMPPDFLEEAPFDVVYNSGVLEHERRPSELIGQMTRITKPGGYVVVTVPNETGLFYKRFKGRERTTKEGFRELIRIPVEHRRYNPDISKLMEENGLCVVREDGLQVAPSAPIRREDLRGEDLDFFNQYLPRRDSATSIEDRVNAWTVLELYAPRDFRVRYGWSRFYVGQKPAA